MAPGGGGIGEAKASSSQHDTPQRPRQDLVFAALTLRASRARFHANALQVWLLAVMWVF